MPSRTYLCNLCGVVRRSTATPSWRGGQSYPPIENALQHCGKVMKALTYEQGVAATHIEAPDRIQGAVLGLHIFRRGGKRKWIPAVTCGQIEQAKSQYAEYLAMGEEAQQNAMKAHQHSRRKI